MKEAWLIACREFRGYFLSPVAYVFVTAFLAVIYMLFFRSFFVMEQVQMRSFFELIPWIFLFFVPAVAMGRWAEEKKSGTIELTMTLPLRDWSVVIGKFGAALGLVLVAIALTFPIPFVISFLGELDWGPVIGGYVGLIGLAAAYVAISVWTSSLTDSHIVAFILGVVVSFLLFVLGEPLVTTAVPSALAGICRYLGLATHFDSIGRGVLDTRDIVYYVSVIGFFLSANYSVIQMRRIK